MNDIFGFNLIFVLESIWWLTDFWWCDIAYYVAAFTHDYSTIHSRIEETETLWSTTDITKKCSDKAHNFIKYIKTPSGTSWWTGWWRWPPWRTSPAWPSMWRWVVWIDTWLSAPCPRLAFSYWALPAWWFVHGENLLPVLLLSWDFFFFLTYNNFYILSFSATSVKKSSQYEKQFGSLTTPTNMRTWFAWWERWSLCWRERSEWV